MLAHLILLSHDLRKCFFSASFGEVLSAFCSSGGEPRSTDFLSLGEDRSGEFWALVLMLILTFPPRLLWPPCFEISRRLFFISRKLFLVTFFLRFHRWGWAWCCIQFV